MLMSSMSVHVRGWQVNNEGATKNPLYDPGGARSQARLTVACLSVAPRLRFGPRPGYLDPCFHTIPVFRRRYKSRMTTLNKLALIEATEDTVRCRGFLNPRPSEITPHVAASVVPQPPLFTALAGRVPVRERAVWRLRVGHQGMFPNNPACPLHPPSHPNPLALCTPHAT
jgi:hypothetical protein